MWIGNVEHMCGAHEGVPGNCLLRDRFQWTTGWEATEGSRLKGGVGRTLAQNGCAGGR